MARSSSNGHGPRARGITVWTADQLPTKDTRIPLPWYGTEAEIRALVADAPKEHDDGKPIGYAVHPVRFHA